MPAMRTESASFIAHGLVREGGEEERKKKGGLAWGSFYCFLAFLSTALFSKCWFFILSVSAHYLSPWILGDFRFSPSICFFCCLRVFFRFCYILT